MYHIIDGKQRLLTILKFSENEISLDPEFGDERFNGKKFNELEADDLRPFWNYIIAVDFMETKNITVIKDVFYRLNKNSKNLNAQELRHAQFEGWFVTEAEDEVKNETLWQTVKVVTATKSRRMLDVQFISELLMILREEKIAGFNQEHISNFYAANDFDMTGDETDFDVDNFRSEKMRVKTYIQQMIKSDAVKNWLSTKNNLYTLWAIIALHGDELPTASILISKYEKFMLKVAQVGAGATPLDQSKQGQHADTYYRNSRGTSTDLKQRQARFNSLKEVLLRNENS